MTDICPVCTGAMPMDNRPRVTCSRKCAQTWASRKRWESTPVGDDYLRPDGYVVTWRRGIKELEHRVVAEEILGRPLADGEIVHHVNHDRADNRPENLEVISSQSEHVSGHHGAPCAADCTCKRHDVAQWTLSDEGRARLHVALAAGGQQ